VTLTSSRSGKFESKFYHKVYAEEFGTVRTHNTCCCTLISALARCNILQQLTVVNPRGSSDLLTAFVAWNLQQPRRHAVVVGLEVSCLNPFW
jgi:hypothetical protein